MSNVFKRIIVLFVVCLLSIFILINICFNNEVKNHREIENVDNLSGQKIGVISAYEGDYILTDREDITLLRYDNEADLFMAMCYKQVDAIALTRDNASYFLAKTTGLKVLEDQPIAKTGMATLFQEDSKLLHEYNEFLAEYKQTEDYQDYIERVENVEFYDGSPIVEETGTGETIVVGYYPDYIPVAFHDVILDKPNGSEIEIIIKFANAYNYKIKWEKSSEEGMGAALYAGMYDIGACGYSDVYRDECEASPVIDLSDNYRDDEILLMVVEDYEKLSITTVLDEEEE